MLNNKLYGQLKWVAQILLPAVATFWITFGNLWGLPEPEKVAATIMAVDTLLGILLGLSTAKYNADPSNFDGELTKVPQDDGSHQYALNFDADSMEEVAEKGQLRLKVTKQP